MKDDGYRLYLSLNDFNDYTINEMLTGNSIIHKGSNYISDSLDKKVVLQHIQNLQEALLSSRKRVSLRMMAKASYSTNLVIKEERHDFWKITFNNKAAELHDGKLKYQPHFDITGLLQAINRLYCSLLAKGISLHPKRDIVRRIADVGVLVWVHDGHSVVCYEKNIQGITMTNCLIDGVYYDYVIVSSSEEMGTVNMFDKELNKEILEWPLDDSILAYYPDIAAKMN